MSFAFFLKAPIGLLPVLGFLGALLYLDSFRLISLATILRLLAAGAGLAVIGYIANGALMAQLDLDFTSYSRYGAPIVEESLKAGAVAYLFLRNRLAFMVDAAIAGVAIGAGFALAENVYQLYLFTDSEVSVWLIRGFGTAIMHGGVTAIFAVLAQSLTNRHSRFDPLLYLPGLLAAILLHSLFNHLTTSPLYAAIAMVVVLPLILLIVFGKSEHKIHDWLLHEYESHEQLLKDIESGAFAHSEAGRFVMDVARRFDRATAEDIFAYIKLHTELVLRAEEILLAREQGRVLEVTEEDRERFARLHALERKIGRTALLVLWPHLHFTRQELWELYNLERRARRRHKRRTGTRTSQRRRG